MPQNVQQLQPVTNVEQRQTESTNVEVLRSEHTNCGSPASPQTPRKRELAMFTEHELALKRFFEWIHVRSMEVGLPDDPSLISKEEYLRRLKMM